MRILKLAIYILAVLATHELSAAANAAPGSIQEANVKHASSQQLKPSVLQLLSSKDTAIPQPATVVSSATRQIPSTNNQKLLRRVSAELAQATTLSDIQGNWAESFIRALAARDIIRGFPDGTFRPEQPVTRAEFAAILRKAFPKNPIREAITFTDVPEYYWGYEAIQEAYRTGFLAGYPNSLFLPNQNIPRVQALVSLANGLNLSTTTDAADILNNAFQDAAQIPDFARTPVAAATASRLVVNYPNTGSLNPNQVATRADVAAFIYQALANAGQVPQLSATETATQYIVGYQPPAVETPSTSTPEEVAQLRQDFRLQVPPLQELVRTGTIGGGGSSIGSPTAFGANFGNAFIGVGFQARTRFTDSADGGVSAGIGLGNSRTAVGLEATISSFSTIREGGFFETGGVSLKLHRLVSNDTAIAFGVENAFDWGGSDAGRSFYGVASKIFPLRENPADAFSKLTVSAGLGGGRFRSESDIRNGNDTVNVFASAGLQVIPAVSVIADWTGQDLILGASVAPFRGIPLVITPAVADVTGNAGDGARFILGVGYAFSF